MAERKDKKKVIGEPMTDDQIKFFLNYAPEEGVNEDFHLLEKAYRALRAEDFARFVAFFQEEGRDINARDPQGRTLLDIMERHGKSEPFAQVLRDAASK